MNKAPLRAMTLAVLAAGCGLISSDIATISFALPSKSYTFDTASAAWKAPPGNFPMVSCGDGGLVADCCQGVPGGPAVDCQATPLICDQGYCALSFPVSVVQKVNLKNEVPELSSLSGQSLVDVSIKRIQYQVTMNTLDIPLPAIDLFLAPENVMSADDPAAQKLGTVPETPAMQTGGGDVVLEPGGQALFSMYARNFGTPFNFIARAKVIVRGGSAAPTGAATITVSGTVSAKPSL